MLEIGVCMEYTDGGQSINMWKDYFENVEIFTFDIVDMSDNPTIKDNDNVFFYRGDQSDRNDLKDMFIEFGSKKYDFIVEDGSHIHSHQMISFAHLFKYVKSGGIYILEDVSIPGNEVCCIRNDETYETVINFIETGNFNSEYITKEEKEYIQNNVNNVEIFTDIQNMYQTMVFFKK